MKRSAMEEYRELLRSVYGHRARAVAMTATPAKSPRVYARHFDQGEPVVGAQAFVEYDLSAAAGAEPWEEYDVALSNPRFKPCENAQCGSRVADTRSELAVMTVVEPEHVTEPAAQLTPAEPQPRPSGGVGREFTRRQLNGLIADEELLSDLQSILGTNEPSRAQSPAPAAPHAASAKARPKVDEPPEPVLKNEHAIFDRIAQNMKYATAYDLGAIELQRRFDEFDRQASPRPLPTLREPRSTRAVVAPRSAPAVSLGTGPVESAVLAESVAHRPVTATDPGWPAPPKDLRPYTDAERQGTFGQFRYESDPAEFGGDGIRILGGWESDNIVSVPIPQLVGKLCDGRQIKRGGIRFHKAGQHALIDLWTDWERAGLLDKVVTYDGGFAARYIRGTQDRDPRPLSNHAWGTAFDINADWNRLGAEPARVGQAGCVRELVEIANRNGFYWGGHFGRARDGMHFELGKRV